MKHFFYVISAIIVFNLFSCQSLNNSTVKHNDNIEVAERNKIDSIAKQSYKYLVAKDYESISDICINGVKDSIYVIKKAFGSLDLVDSFESTPYDEWLIRPGNSGIVRIVSNEKKYYLVLSNINFETCVYMTPIFLKGAKSEYLLSFIFNKVNNHWLIANLSIMLYNYNGKGAEQYYQMSKDYFSKNDFLKSYSYIQFANNISRPGGSQFHYFDEDSMNIFLQKVASTINENHIFPIAVKTKYLDIKIINYKNASFRGGISPEIFYKTGVDFDDSIALNDEGANLNDVISNYIPDICDFSDTVIYRVIKQNPDNTYRQYSFVKPCKS